MKKTTYLEKLAATKITDDNTVGEAKVAKRVEAELKRFWRKAALAYIRENEAKDDILIDAPWIKVDMEFNLKAEGSVAVKLLNYDKSVPYAPGFLEMKRYTVPKRNLFK